MAELEESVPEIVYPSLSMIESGSCKKDEVCVKCPLCKQFGTIYYCVDCVKNGNFVHSKNKCFERFADKKVSRYKLDEEKAAILEKYEEKFSKKKLIENLKVEIYKSKEKIQLLSASIKTSKDAIANNEKMIEDIKKENSKYLANQSVLSNKLYKTRTIHIDKTAELEKNTRKLELDHRALDDLTERRIKELIKYIFPIKAKMVSPSRNSYEQGRSAELAEALKTTYIEGQWVIAANAADDIQYTVVKPCIPSSGDYSPYIDWCTEHKGISRASLSTTEKYRFDRAYGISAALSYTAQLINILALYMNAYLPKKSSFSDFCEPEPSKIKFLHKVAKLNANIISLCLSQNIDITKVNCHRTIENLLLVLKSKKRQSSNIMDENLEELMQSIEDSLTRDMLEIDDSDNDEMEREFVHISEDDVPDYCEQPAEEIPQATLVSSVFSFFRAATGQS